VNISSVEERELLWSDT